MESRLSGPGDSFGGYRTRLAETLQGYVEQMRVTLLVPPPARTEGGHRAYEDAALPIGAGQTISRPFTQARYLEALRLAGSEKVLEVGTGSGYQTALLGALAGQVFSVERVRSLAEAALRTLRAAGCRNVSVLVGDGTLGWSAYAPFDAILVAAGGPVVPAPLLEQLAPGGRLLIPLGEQGRGQTLTLVERTPSGVRHTPLGEARFVPLLGEHGFDA